MAAETTKEPQAGLLAQAQHYWRIFLKWKWTAFVFLLAAVAVAVFYSLSLTPIYTANGTIWIEDDPKILPFDDVQSFEAGSNLQSHARLLRSRSLASDVIDKMKLYENDYFAGKIKETEIGGKSMKGGTGRKWGYALLFRVFPPSKQRSKNEANHPLWNCPVCDGLRPGACRGRCGPI